MKEEWRTIIYRNTDEIQVSNTGRVMRRGKELNQRTNHDGYTVVSLKSDYIKNPWRSVNIAILVATAFIPKPNDYDTFEVNHKDYDRQNNYVNNLEWLTHADNVRYSVCNKPDMKGVNNPNYGNRKLSQIYKNNPQLALEKQSRKGKQNGRCVKVKLYKDNELIKEFDYFKLCLQYLIDEKITTCKNVENLRSRVDKALKEKGEYKGFTIVKER